MTLYGREREVGYVLVFNLVLVCYLVYEAAESGSEYDGCLGRCSHFSSEEFSGFLNFL